MYENFKHSLHLNNAKYCFTPASSKGLPIHVWIQKPYKINPTDVPTVITVANPLQEKKKREM